MTTKYLPKRQDLKKINRKYHFWLQAHDVQLHGLYVMVMRPTGAHIIFLMSYIKFWHDGAAQSDTL
jgi:hypothetical protein